MAGMDELESELSETRRQLSALRTLHEITKAIHVSSDLTTTMDAVVHGVTAASGFEVAVVNLRGPDGNFAVVSVDGTDDIKRELLGTASSEETWEKLFSMAEQWGSLYFVDHAVSLPDGLLAWVPDLPAPVEPGGWHPEDCLFAPLTAPDGTWVGILSVDLPRDNRRPGPLQREMLELFAQHAAIAVHRARLHDELEQSRDQLHHAATHDSLTGLANRTLLRTHVDQLAGAPVHQIGVLAIDLDDFKLVNDTAGHDVGDEILREVAVRMQDHLRPTDLLARTGGDEFVAVLAGPEAWQATAEVATALRSALTQPFPTCAGAKRIGASIGIALGDTTDEFPQLLKNADTAMYREKRTHRPQAA